MQNAITFNDHSGKLYQNGFPYTSRIFINDKEAFVWLEQNDEERFPVVRKCLTQCPDLIE